MLLDNICTTNQTHVLNSSVPSLFSVMVSQKGCNWTVEGDKDEINKFL